MILIFKKIKSITTVMDIEEFVKSALTGGFFIRHGWIESINIQEIRDTRKKSLEYNALVMIKPDSVGKRVIRRLNRKALNNKHINIAEYQTRFRDNDRRNNRYQKLNTRRKADRRRNIEITDITEHRKTPVISLKALGWNTDYTV